MKSSGNHVEILNSTFDDSGSRVNNAGQNSFCVSGEDFELGLGYRLIEFTTILSTGDCFKNILAMIDVMPF